MVAHTFWAVYGMSRWRTPSGLSASITAFATAAVEPNDPDSQTTISDEGMDGNDVK
jgi:hypothetical protein